MQSPRSVRARRVYVLAPLLAALLLPAAVQGADLVKVDADSVMFFLYSCQKPNGAFGPREQEYSDLAWTTPAVHALSLLGAEVPRKDDCLKHGQIATWRFPYWDLYNKTRLEYLLRRAKRPAAAAVTLKYQSIGEKHWEPEFTFTDDALSYWNLETLWQVTGVLELRKQRVANPAEVAEFVLRHQSSDGDFGGHVNFTSQAVVVLSRLQHSVLGARQSVAWLLACQTPEGGFRWHPTDTSPSNQPDALYTWMAVQALSAMNMQPKDRDACMAWLNSLQNADGGFGDRPGWRSRVATTFYALDALRMLSGEASSAVTAKELPAEQVDRIAPGKYQIFQAHHKSPKGDVAMVERVREMRLDLIAVKAPPADVQPLRDYVREKGYALEIVACPENYGHRMALLGIPEGNHISNFIIRPDMNAEQRSAFERAMVAGDKNLPWTEFKKQTIAPVMAMKTLFYPEHDYDMTNAYRMYDDALSGEPGYNAIHATHFGGKRPDWIRLYPYRERWLGRLPMLADGDAHGDIEKWAPELMRARILYLAEKPDLDSYLDASLNARSVCVLRDESVPSGVVYYGPAPAVEYVKARRSEWQWW